MTSGWSKRGLAPTKSLPLCGKKVMITAPRQYASKLANLLVEAGARPLWLPSIEVTSMPEEECANLDRTLGSLDKFTHLAFTSKNGIISVIDRLEKVHNGVDKACAFIKLSGVRLCALGADTTVLEGIGLEAHVQPKEASTLGLVCELGELGEIKGAKVLCPVPSVRGQLVEPPVVPRFLNALTENGAEAHRVDSYVTRIGSCPEECSVEKELLTSGEIDAIVFTSTAEAQGLAYLMGSKDIIRQAVDTHNIILAAHGPYTAKGAGNFLGMKIGCVPETFSSFAGVVKALEDRVHVSS